jgi:hypothetical protein
MTFKRDEQHIWLEKSICRCTSSCIEQNIKLSEQKMPNCLGMSELRGDVNKTHKHVAHVCIELLQARVNRLRNGLPAGFPLARSLIFDSRKLVVRFCQRHTIWNLVPPA